MKDIRALLLPISWRLLWPLRLYLRRFPVETGKGLLARLFLTPILPRSPAAFLKRLPGGAAVLLQYREALGLITLIHGEFEAAETRLLCARAKPGTCVIDVGANIGILTVAVASAMGANGRVWAFEPLPSNIERLRENLRLNGVNNVDVYPLALGNRAGEVTFHLSHDPLFHSTVCVAPKRDSGRTITIAMDCLDSFWNSAGRPEVSLIKIDVEGAELEVLQGCQELLCKQHPILLLEANSGEQLERLLAWLKPRGYSHSQPRGFMHWNHLFSPDQSAGTRG